MTLIEVWADSRGKSRCRGCGASITWTEVVATGKKMPFSGEPVALRTRHDKATRKLVEEIDLAENHWASCPDANQFRRRT